MRHYIILSYCISVFVSLLVFCGPAKAQSALTNMQPPTVERNLTILKAEPLAISLFQERKMLTYNTTILYGLGAYYSFFDNSFPPLIGNRFIALNPIPFGREYSTNAFTPYALIGARKYFSFGRRVLKGKDTQNNAASYVGLLLELPLSDRVIEKDVPNLEIAYPVSLLYGLRRNLGNRLFLDLEAGLSYKVATTIGELGPRLNLAFNYRLK